MGYFLILRGSERGDRNPKEENMNDRTSDEQEKRGRSSCRELILLIILIMNIIIVTVNDSR